MGVYFVLIFILYVSHFFRVQKFGIIIEQFRRMNYNNVETNAKFCMKSTI